MNETEETKVWMPGVSPALYERQLAELTKLKSDVERLLTRSLKCFGHDESCEVEKCDLDRDDDACACEYKPLVADIEAFLKTVAPKL